MNDATKPDAPSASTAAPQRPLIFQTVLSSILGAVVGSAPGALMSALAEKGGHADKWAGHVMMIGGMIGAMVGHDLMKGEHSQPGVKAEKEPRGR